MRCRRFLGDRATRTAGIGTEIVCAEDAMTHPLRVFQELLGEVSDRSSRPDESRGLLTADEREAAGVPEGQADVSSPSSSENEERPRHDERAEHRVLGQWAGRVDRNKIPAEGYGQEDHLCLRGVQCKPSGFVS